jgi:hypothetical protein
LSTPSNVDVIDFTRPAVPVLVSYSLAERSAHVVQLDAGTRRLGIDTDADGMGASYFSLPLGAGADLLVALGADGTPFLLTVDGSGTTARFDPAPAPFAQTHFVNLYHSAVDFFTAANTPTIGGIATGATGGRVPVPAGTHVVDVAPVGQPRMGSFAASAPYTFVDETNVEVIVFADSIGAKVVPIPGPDTTNIPAGEVRVQAFHGAGGFPPADLIVNGVRRVDDLPAGSVSAAFTMPSTGSATVGFDLTQDGVADFSFSVSGLADQGAYTMIGASNGGVPYLLMVSGHGNGAIRFNPL